METTTADETTTVEETTTIEETTTVEETTVTVETGNQTVIPVSSLDIASEDSLPDTDVTTTRLMMRPGVACVSLLIQI